MQRQTLKSKLDRCCNIMRDDGLVPLQYVEQLSWFLFLKLFEEWEEKKYLIKQNYQSIFEKKYSWSNWHKKTGEDLKNFIEQELLPYLSNLSGTSQKMKIASIFKQVRNYMRSGYNLADVIQVINSIDFSKPEDTQILSIAYEELLTRVAGEGGGAGEFYTPRPLIKFMVKIVNPKISERILDPFCGSAGFLIESYKYLRNKPKVTLKEHKILQEKTFYGQEFKSFPLIVGTLNSMIHGIESPNIIETNSFAEDIRSIPEKKRFNIILTNPPFGGEAAKRSLASFTIKTSNTELAGLYLSMRKLKTGGRCGIVQPEGILFRTSGAYKQVKKELLANYNLHTIISLPSGVFACVSPKGGQGPKTNLLFFEKGKPTKEIWYYELQPPKGRKNYTKTRPIKDEDLEDAYKRWEKREISENSWIEKVEDIIERNYDLSAKNPNKMERKVYRKPKELVESVMEKEEEISILLEKLKRTLK